MPTILQYLVPEDSLSLRVAAVDRAPALADTAAAAGVTAPVLADTTGGLQVTAADIFGPLTALAEPAAGSAPWSEWVLTGGLFYSAAVLAIFAGFCLLLHYFMPHAVTVFNAFRGTLYIEKILDEHNYIFETFRRLLILLGILTAGLVVVRYLDLGWGAAIAGRLPRWALPLPVVAVWAGLLAAWILQTAMLRTAGWLTYSQKFTSRVVSLRNLLYGLIFLLSVPFMLTIALAGGRAIVPLSVIFFIIFGFLVIFLLIRTYMLFIGQKISILYWFLYLCAVEILPVSFLVILTVRNLMN
ncbi:MAG: DUF4271 domain-containing protein [Alistipes sp.]|nr:DUF4271 domain-containing protein [Alistipes sp.]